MVSIEQIQRHQILTLECENERLKERIKELEDSDITIERHQGILEIPDIGLHATEEDRL